MSGSQGVLLIMMGSLILFLVWHPASPFNTATTTTKPTASGTTDGGGTSNLTP